MMGKLNFDDYADVAEFMTSMACSGKTVAAVLYYDAAVQLMRELMADKDIDISIVDIESKDYSGYNKEYYIVLDNEMSLYIEKTFDEELGQYLSTYSDIVLLDPNASSLIVAENDDCTYYAEMYICEDCDECCNENTYTENVINDLVAILGALFD